MRRFFRFVLMLATFVYSISGCVTAIKPQVESNARYLSITQSATVIAEIDARDGATCGLFVAEAIKNNPQARGLTKCLTLSLAQQLRFSASLLDNSTNITYTVKTRTAVICQNFLDGMTKNGSGITVAAGCK